MQTSVPFFVEYSRSFIKRALNLINIVGIFARCIEESYERVKRTLSSLIQSFLTLFNAGPG